jgi:hypothetical protein
MTTYTPKPTVTEHVQLPEELTDLVEKLAKNNHDRWAKQRISEGWRYGEVRNDELKTHPDLVDYDELLESEKQYDRISVVETLKSVIALGYEIKRYSR